MAVGQSTSFPPRGILFTSNDTIALIYMNLFDDFESALLSSLNKLTCFITIITKCTVNFSLFTFVKMSTLNKFISSSSSSSSIDIFKDKMNGIFYSDNFIKIIKLTLAFKS